MGLTGTTSFPVGNANTRCWFRVHSTGGWSGWRAWTSGKIDGLFYNYSFLGNRLQYSYDDTLTYQFRYVAFKVVTDAAGCSSLSFSFAESVDISGCSFAKTTTDVTSASGIPSSWASTSKSGKTFSVSNVSMLPNTTYYVWLRSDDTTTGHFATGTCTISGSGTYGSPGNITANNTNFDSPINMSYASSTSGGTYTVKVKVGSSAEVTLQTQSSTSSRSWTPALSTYGSSYPNQSSVSCVITVSTYFGGVLAGTKTKTVTISFTAAQAGPSTSSAFSIAPYNTSPIAGMTGYIQNYSKIRASFTSGNVTTRYGATISKWTVKFGSAAATDVATSTTTKDSGVISATTSVVCTVVDSRGFTASETYTATITPYQTPSLTTASGFRCDSTATADDAGTYVAITISTLYADIDSQNTIAVQAFSKLASSATYGAAVDVLGGTTSTSGTNDIYAITDFLISGYADAVYDIKIVATDALGNTDTKYLKITSQAWALHFRNGGAGAAIGKVAEADNQLQIPDDWEYYRGVNKAVLSAYPVGSIYMSVNSTNPGTLFGGTWERITGRFLLAATDGGAAGGNGNASIAPGYTGGEATHTLSAAEMPAHNHQVLQASGNGNSIVPNGLTNGARTIAAYHAGCGWIPAGSTYIGQKSWEGDTNSKGSSSAHNNMPPYLAVYVWKRTA